MEGSYIDSNVFVALFTIDDSLHERAVATLKSTPSPYLVHEYVVLETTTVLLTRTGKASADLFLETVARNADFALIESTPMHFNSTMRAFREGRSKLSFTDVALLNLAHEYTVVTFDEVLNRSIKKQNAGK